MAADILFPQLKVCGVTRPSDLELMAEAGVGAVGLNLVPSSKRKIELNEATLLAARARQLGIRVAAVVMDPDPEHLIQVAQAYEWDYLQLHGREAPTLADHCASIPIVKAISWSGRSEEEELVGCWSQWERSHHRYGSNIPLSEGSQAKGSLPPRLAGFLVDAYAPLEGGGTGRVADWQLLWPRPQVLEGWPMILAGGLHPGNVKQAIEQTRCDAVDVASGVEIQPGIKSREAVLEFARQAKQGFLSLLS